MDGRKSAEMISGWQRGHLSGSLVQITATGSGWTEARMASREGGGHGGTDQGGSMPRRQEGTKEIPDAAMPATFLRQRETGKELGTAPRTRPLGLEALRAPEERPSCRCHQGTLSASSGRLEEEAASWGNAPRPSAGRPREVSP